MSTVQSLVTTIQDDYAPKIGRTLLLGYINRAVQVLTGQDCAQTTYYNTSDDSFPFPYISTTTGTLEYEMTSSNLVDSDGATVSPAINGTTVAIRRVKRVIVSGTTMRTQQYNPNFRGESINLTGINPYWKSRLYYDNYQKVVGMPMDKTENQAAKWIFAEDPGTETDVYLAECFWEHPTVDAESDTLLIDQQRWEQALIDGAVGYIEDFQHGESRRLEKFQTYWKKQFCGDMNIGFDSRRPRRFLHREML